MIKSINLSAINKNISFGSIKRTVFKDSKTEEIKYRNNTYMFRNDLDWDNVIYEITKDKVPKKIYCYACSDGSEPYSIAIVLISKLGYEAAQKYFPIIARDLDEKMINSAKSGKINLSLADIKTINMYESKSEINFFDKFSSNNIDIFCNEGTVSDKLRQCVEFEVGDICEDSRDFDYNNIVIFFRNALPYLSYEERSMLLATFARNLNDKTAIVIGGYDKYILKSPLLHVQNNTFGLMQPTDCFYKGTRLKNMSRLHCFCMTENYPKEYISTANQIDKRLDIRKYNKFIKSRILSNNQKACNQSSFIRRR